MKRKYAIVDIETTGGLSNRDKITEIGIVISDGIQIIDTYETLVNPERSIPANITSITGITNQMVANAPKFYEIAKKVIEMLEGTIFVAHNVRFDYGFIKQEFKTLGFTFTKRQLCTVVMSRKAFPGIKSYSLGNLIKYFDIEVNSRHRALEDAVATTDIFHRILEKYETTDATKMMINMSLKDTKLPKNIDIEQLDALPETCGVYYLLDEEGQVVYIGKSINIQKRVISHFGKITKKSERLMQRVSEINFEETGSEIVALLKEAVEIKKIQPEINRAQKKYRLPFGLYADKTKDGYTIFKVCNLTKTDTAEKKILSSFEKQIHAKNRIKDIIERFELCLKLNNQEKSKGPCFHFTLEKCLGVCIGSELPQSYNQRAALAIQCFQNDFEDNFFLIDKGRSDDERSVVLVEEGSFKGYGYIDSEQKISDIEEMKEAIQYQKIIPREANALIRQYIWKNPKVEILYY